MDSINDETPINYFNTTANETFRESLLRSRDPTLLESVMNSGLFTSKSFSNASRITSRPQNILHPSNPNKDLLPSLPVIPGMDEEEVKLPIPPPPLYTSHLMYSSVSSQDNKKTTDKLLEDELELSMLNGQSRINGKASTVSRSGSFVSPTFKNASNREEVNHFAEKRERHCVGRFGTLIKLETLSKGVFGEIYRVFDKDEKQFYAVKEIQLQNTNTKEQFDNVVKAEMNNLLTIRQANKPNLINLFGINFQPEACSCTFLMELGKGTLHEFNQFRLNQKTQWEEKELLFIISQLLKQIDLLRTLGIFHRDIKPENIIMTDRENNLKLIDFGCAGLLVEGTQTFNIAGTPSFMAPELTQSLIKKQKQADYDPYLADLFSTAITILKLVQPSIKRSELKEYCDNNFKQNYPKLYPYINGLMSLDLEIRKKTAKDLLTMTVERMSFTHKEENDYKSFLFQKTIEKSEDKLDPSLYFEMFKFEEADVTIRKQISKEEKNINSGSLRLLEWKIVLAQFYMNQKRFETATGELEGLLKHPYLQKSENPNCLVKAKTLFWLGNTWFMSRKLENAIQKLKECLEIRIKILGEYHEEVAAVYLRLGHLYFNQSKYEQALQSFQNSISINIACGNENILAVAKIYNNIGVILETQRRYKEAQENFEQALQIYKKLYGEDYPYVADQNRNIGGIFFSQKKYTEAIEYYSKALDIMKEYYGENSPEVAILFEHIGTAFESKSKYDEAIKYFTKSADIYTDLYGRHSLELAQIFFDIANIYFKQCKYDQAIEHHFLSLGALEEDNPLRVENSICCGRIYQLLGIHNKAYKSCHKALEQHHSKAGEDLKVAQLYKEIALIRFAEKKKFEALNFADRAIIVCKEASKKEKSFNLHQDGNFQCFNCLEILGTIAKEEGKYSEALAYFEKMLNAKEKEFGIDHYECGLSYLMVAEMKHKLKMLDQALSYYKNASRTFTKLLPEDHYMIGLVTLKIGTLFKDQGKINEASRDLGRAQQILQKCIGRAQQILKELLLKEEHPIIKECQQKISELNRDYLGKTSNY